MTLTEMKVMLYGKPIMTKYRFESCPDYKNIRYMKLEIIFNLEGTDQYRVVCKYNHDSWVKHVWWGYLERKITYKRWGFFGKEIVKWTEINSCWWDKSFETREELEQAALKLYDENVLLYKRLTEKAKKIVESES